MTTELTEKQASKLNEAVKAKAIFEKEYRQSIQRENDILELICDAHGLTDVTNVRLDGKVLSYDKATGKKK